MLDIFAEKINFVFLIFIPIAIGLFVLVYFSKKKSVLKYFKYENYIKNGGFNLKINYIVRAVFFSLFLLFLVFSLARPQWGQKTYKIKREGIDIVIAVDISKSMNAEDIKPSRYFLVKRALRKFLKNLNGDRVALMFFGQDAFTMIPFTLDYYTVNLALDNLNPSDFPMPGTNYANLFLRAKSLFSRSNASKKIMIIFSDGEDLEKSPSSFLKLDGVTVYTVGVGTDKGGIIPLFNEKGEKIGVKKYNGKIVISKLEENTLKKIAYLNSGKYMRLNYSLDAINYILHDIEKYKKGKLDEFEKVIKIERYRIFLLIALVFLFLETIFINFVPKFDKKYTIYSILKK